MNFVLVVIEVLLCFVAGFFLLKPNIRRMFPTGFLGGAFYLEGVWSMVNYIVSGIWPDNIVMDIIRCIIAIIVSSGVIYTIIKMTKTIEKRKKLQKPAENSDNQK